jgi:hypothetical protein
MAWWWCVSTGCCIAEAAPCGSPSRAAGNTPLRAILTPAATAAPAPPREPGRGRLPPLAEMASSAGGGSTGAAAGKA